MPAAPIEKLAGPELPPFPDDEQHAIYDLLVTAEAEQFAAARSGGVTADLEVAA